MQLYTLQKEIVPSDDGSYSFTRFGKKDDIDSYESLIWTERYFGDGDVQLVCPPTKNFINKIQKGSYLGLNESKEMMMVETAEVADGKYNINGISVLPWFNNRFVRTSKQHKVRTWQIDDMYPGEILWAIISMWTDNPSLFVPTEDNTGIPQAYLNMLMIPELGLLDTDRSGDQVSAQIEFERIYDAMSKVAIQYNIGMQIRLLHEATTTSSVDPSESFKPLGFRSYVGLDRTHLQSEDGPFNEIVTFSKALESLANPRELHSLTNYKSLAIALGPNLDTDLGNDNGDHNVGLAWVQGKGPTDPNSSGLDCRAIQIFDENLNGFTDSLSSEQIQQALNLLNKTARTELKGAAPIDAIDGEIVSTKMYKYERDYYLGDLIEIEGENGIISQGRVMEYIRSKDVNGERGYPSITLVDPKNITKTRSDLGPKPNHPYDNVGDAHLLSGNSGSIQGTNVDCSTDGVSDSGNTDWLVNRISPMDSPENDKRNWHTTWYKWQVHEDVWTPSMGGELLLADVLPGDGGGGGTPTARLKLHLTDYDSHMVLFVCTPLDGAIPDSGDPPSSGHKTSYRTLGWDITDKSTNPPYNPLVVVVHKNWWADSTYEKWIYIGIGSPPLGVKNQTHDGGGKFTLHWSFST